ISIVPLPFFREDTPGIVPQTLPQWMLYAGIGGLVLLLVLLLLISVLRRKKRRRRKVPAQPMMVEQPLPATKGANIMNVQSEKSMELRKEIRDFADASPEIAAQMIKGWLKGDDESNA
ncbi:MAG: flagellar M-ring protein FliF, partial [Oscillospiraceae bacterium]